MLFLCCALPCEAEPLIEYFSLKQVPQRGPFPLYHRDGYYLTISGVGKIPMAMACAMLYNQQHVSSPIWLNIGCAGHAHHSLGSPYLIHKITDFSRKTHFYPSFAFSSPCSTETLLTVESPETQYAQNTLYDMEGSGFFEAARRFSPLELIHCFKVVSDNHQEKGVTKMEIAESIQDHLTLLKKIIALLLDLQKKLTIIEEKCPSDLTFTEKVQWQDLVRQCKALKLPLPPLHNKSSLNALKTLVKSHVPSHLY